MGKGNGGTRTYSPYSRGGGKTVAVTTGGKGIPINITDIGNPTSISSMQHRDMEKEINQAISRYEAVMGLRETKIMLADTPGAYGVTFFNGDGSKGIYLDRSKFDVSKAQFAKEYAKSNYARRGGFKNVTRKPAQHTVTHELAHATWTSGYTSDKHRAAGQEIRQLYKDFTKDTSTSRKKNYGSYGTKNVDEFWAEIITKGIHGDNDKYTRKAFAIAKKYKL